MISRIIFDRGAPIAFDHVRGIPVLTGEIADSVPVCWAFMPETKVTRSLGLGTAGDGGERHRIIMHCDKRFSCRLKAGETWHSCILYALKDGRRVFKAPRDCVEKCGLDGAPYLLSKLRLQD